MFYTASVANGASNEKFIVPAGLKTLKVMLAYSDIGAVPGSPNIQVNDLDILGMGNNSSLDFKSSSSNVNATRGG
jgi:hypothetical protein